MKDGKLNILIAEPSFIIFEGLVSIVGKSGYNFRILKASELHDIQKIQLNTSIDLVLINPSLIQNQVKMFLSLKNEMTETKWMGIIYSLFNKQLFDHLDGIISANDTPAVILDSIRKLIMETTVEHVHTGQQPETLSEREIEVLKLLVSGNSNKEIADKLFISIHTVISHRKNISQKTDIKTVSGLTIYAVVNKIISIEK
jgi:DNA-binding CsgD family transcriptional regulator